MSKVKVAVVGAGHLGRIHIKLIQQVAGADLVAVAEPQPLIQQQLHRDYDVQVVSDYKKLENVDAVVIATPTVTHHEVASHFLSQGIHTLIEKPLTHCSEQANELLNLAEQNNCVVQIGHVERFNPAVSKALEYVGTPKFIEASRQSGYTFRSTDIGVVHDLMIHDIELINWIFGSEVVDSRSVGMSVFGNHEDIARSWIHFQCGGVANLTASRCSFSPERTMKIFGTEGFASIDLTTSTLKAIRIPSWVRQREFDFQACSLAQVDFVKANLFEQVLPVEEVAVARTNAILDEQSDWIEAIHEGRSPRVHIRAGVAAVDVAQRVLDQISMHSWAEGDRSMTGPFAVPPITSMHTDPMPLGLLQADTVRKAG